MELFSGKNNRYDEDEFMDETERGNEIDEFDAEFDDYDEYEDDYGDDYDDDYDDDYGGDYDDKELSETIGYKAVKVIFMIIGRVFKYAAILFGIALCVITCIVLGAVNGIVNSTVDVKDINVFPTDFPTTILDDQGNEIIKLYDSGSKRTEMKKEELTENLKWAFVDLEDERFYQHKGVDFEGVLRALYYTVFKGEEQGASTITQQLLKNNVFETGGRERSTGSLIRRKLQEWVLALELEKNMSKDEILVTYLNTINLGGGNYGVKEAAKYYFNKDISELTVAECTVISSIAQNPWGMNPVNYPTNNKTRQTHALENMRDNGHLTEAEYQAACADEVYNRVAENATGKVASEYSYFVDEVISEVIKDLQEQCGYSYTQAFNLVYRGGATIYSTQNTQAQRIVEYEINNPDNYSRVDLTYSVAWDLSVKHADGEMEYYNQSDISSWHRNVLGNREYRFNYYTHEECDAAIQEYKDAILVKGDQITYENVSYILEPQATFTLMDYNTGYVLAISGGRGEKQNLGLNRATESFRQPGSTFKIVASFAPALDLGMATLASTFDDAEFHYGDSGKKVANWWGDEYRGLNTVRQGVIDSMNIVAVKCLKSIGAENCIPYLQSFGYSKIIEEDGNLATAIGGVTWGISNLENCAAFSAIANKGVYIEPTFYSQVVSKDGKVIMSNNQETHRVLKEETASLLTSAMREVVTKGTGVLCQIDSAPLAGKTGSSNDYNDIWFVGYVPNGLCGCIWVGYDEFITVGYNEMQKRFYSKIMEQLVVSLDRGGGWFEMTGDIVQATVCNKSGMLSNGDCGDDAGGSCLITEYFAAGTVPSRSCDIHEKVTICKTSGKLATEYCPEEETEEVVLRNLEDFESREKSGKWTRDFEYAVPYEDCDEHDENTTTETSTEESEETDPTETTKKEEETPSEEEPPSGEEPGGGEEGDD